MLFLQNQINNVDLVWTCEPLAVLEAPGLECVQENVVNGNFFLLRIRLFLRRVDPRKAVLNFLWACHHHSHTVLGYTFSVQSVTYVR